MAGLAVTPTWRDKSARVAQLVNDVTVKRAGALERFWSEAKANGGPFVETIEGNDQEVLVTFLWKEIYETHNVFLVWPGDSASPQDHYMSRVPGTNVWYKSTRVHRGSRFSYQLAPNDRGEYAHPSAQTDPLNPLLFTDGDRSNAYGSILELAGATDESWFRRTPTIRGAVISHLFDSVLLKGRRDVTVYTPPGYAPSNGPYPLVVLFDGPAYISSHRATNTLDNLLADQRIRPTVVAFVSHAPDGTRVGDLGLGPDTREPEARQTFAAAIATELVPWLRSLYVLSRDPKHIVIGRYSAGAGAAAYTAVHYPGVFGNVLSQSVGHERLAQMASAAPRVPVRFYLDVGLYEGGDEPLRIRRAARDVLRAKGYDVIYRETAAAHEGVHSRATLAEGLIGLLGVPDR